MEFAPASNEDSPQTSTDKHAKYSTAGLMEGNVFNYRDGAVRGLANKATRFRV